MSSIIKDYVRDDQNNILDPITYNIIPQDRLIGYVEDNKFWYFDVDTIYRTSEENCEQLTNPYNRKSLPLEIKNKVDEYRAKNDVKIKVFSSGIFNLETKTYSFPYYKEFADALVHIISNSATLARSDFSYFVSRELVNKKTGISVYVYQAKTQMSALGNSEWYFDNFPDFGRQKSCLTSLGAYCESKKNQDYDDYAILSNVCKSFLCPRFPWA